MTFNYINIYVIKNLKTDTLDVTHLRGDDKIVDDSDEIEHQEEIMKDLMMKQQLRHNVQVDIDINDALNGFERTINLSRPVINTIIRSQTNEKITINIKYDTSMPINKPIIIESMGKKYDNMTGDLYVTLNIHPNTIYRINKSNYNLITTQKLSLAQMLCGFDMTIQHKQPINIRYEHIIKPTNIYIIKGKGLTIFDQSSNIVQTDIEVHFDVQFKLTEEEKNNIATAFGYSWESTPNSNAYTLEELCIDDLDMDDDNDKHQHTIFEHIFESQMGGMPDMSSMGNLFGMPTMGRMRGSNIKINVAQPGGQECHQS
jgi:hypothetical protein